MASTVAAGLLQLAFPLLARDLFNEAFGDQAMAGERINRIALLLAGVFAAQAAFNFVRVWLLGRIGERVVATLRTRLYGHLLHLSPQFFMQRKTGEITSRLTSDVSTVQSLVSSALAQFTNQTVTLVGATAALFYIDVPLTLLMLAVVPPTILAGAAFARRLRRLSRRFQDAVADANADAEEAIANIRMVQAFTSEAVEEERYRNGIERSYNLALSRVLVRAWFIPTVIFAMFGGITAVFWFGGRQVIAGALAAGDLIAFLLLSLFIAGSVAGFTGLFSQLQEGLGASRRIFDLLNETPTVRERPNPKPLEAAAWDVQFDRVWFHYPAGTSNHLGASITADDGASEPAEAEPRWVLEDMSLRVPAGETLAVVGESGAGKSTLAALIPRFFDVQKGAVRVAGSDVRDVSLKALRSKIAIVPQETALFSGSIRDNIRYGRPDASDEDVQAAADAAHVTEFVRTLPAGFDATIGERGVRLSGGQRQRIAIARALLKNPPILILDEATSNLDAASEAWVQAALTNLKEGRTSLVIAHRFSTIQDADQIAVISSGRLETVGHHDVLMQTSATYQRLYHHQLATNPA